MSVRGLVCSPFSVWVPGVEFRSSGLAASAFPKLLYRPMPELLTTLMAQAAVEDTFGLELAE